MLSADAATAASGPTAGGLHCNNNSNFSVDSLMTVAGREGAVSPDGRLAADMAASYQQQQHYSACLYHTPGLEELAGGMGGLPQGLLSSPPPPYSSRPSWYAMPNGGDGGQSPTGGSSSGGVDQIGLPSGYPTARDYFEPLGGGGKAPSPGPCAQYRTPPYRTYYSQDCDKY